MKVNTVELQNQASQMRDIVWRMMEIRQAMLRAGDRLMEESIGERFRPAIQAQADSVERLTSDVLQLRRALEQIARTYEDCENQIVDGAEDEHIYKVRPGMISIPPVGPKRHGPAWGVISAQPWRPSHMPRQYIHPTGLIRPRWLIILTPVPGFERWPHPIFVPRPVWDVLANLARSVLN